MQEVSQSGDSIIAQHSVSGITVWLLFLDTIPDKLWRKIDNLLDASEHERAARFHFIRDARQYKAAHALKRLMLTASGGAELPRKWKFESGRWGKPRVTAHPGPHFNLSHCEGLVACAVSWEVDVGVDVERVDRDILVESSARYFSPTEQEQLRRLRAAERTIAFFRLWTAKEAASKALGLGLSLPLDALSFGLDPLRITNAQLGFGAPSSWRFDQRHVGEHHMATVAWRSVSDELPLSTVVVEAASLFESPCK
jgi:4'-phosphopantetheinyl transferase